ncbi:MAG TPA: heterodisulfide reductase-related iron-sulfur binding cluster [Blastocatellia bacterium]|nr:heterodisulfide reductase-related iron-sulfur binding cluster [Blastocatellia bacterium]
MTEQTSLHTALNAEMDKLLGCIHCGLCLSACPTYQQLGNENDSPRGRIYLMRAVAEGRLNADSAGFSRHIDLCLGCRACETACPAGVRYGFLLESARETVLEQEARTGGGFQKTMLKLALRHVFPYPRRLKIVFTFMKLLRGNPLVKFALDRGLVRRVSGQADFALSLLMTSRPVGDVAAAAGPEATGERPVAVFTGCVMEGLFKHANDATRRVLAVNQGQLQDVREQICCGALHAHAGDLQTARQLARKNIDAFDRFLSQESADHPPTIIINAAGCGALLKEYGELLKDDPQYAERARRFSERVLDVTEFLARSEIRRGAEVKRRVTYDAPCHLYHAQRVTAAPQQILAAIPGLEYSPLEGMQDCCGGAGIYNLSEPEMSESLLSDKIEKVKATGAEVLVTANPGCQMQLGAGLRIFKADCRVTHIVELLDESYRRAGFYE